VKKTNITFSIYALLLVGAIITMFIIYKDMNSSFSFAFVSGYIIFLVLSVLYLLITILINMRKLKWREIRNRLFKFFAYFVLLFGVTYIVGYVYEPLKLNLYTILLNSISFSFAFVFIDLVFFKQKRS